MRDFYQMLEKFRPPRDIQKILKNIAIDLLLQKDELRTSLTTREKCCMDFF